MALYTQNSTGFLCEFATNPGIGYTAVAAQPTDTLANRVSWWRDRDKGSLTSTWHPSEQQTGEDPGSNVLYMAFSQESGIVSSDASGVVTDGYLGAVTQIRIMRGVNNVTQSEGWTLGFTAVDSTYTTTGTDVVTLQFTSIPTDKTGGYVNVIATRTGSATLSKTFRVLKVIRGLDGEDGVDGSRGSRQILVSGTSWSDVAAWNGVVAQTGTTPVLTDLVTIADAGTGFSESKFYTGGAYDGDWVTPNAYINGNLLVTGTVGANKLVAGSITTTQLSFVPVTSTNVVSSINATAEGIRISGSRINIDGTVSFGAGYDPTGKIASGGAAGDVNANSTTISGGKITTNSITANQIEAGTITTSLLNFTPVQSTNVVASINASSEGLFISGSRINIDGNVTFSAGYNPTGKIASGEAATDINNNSTTINGGKITTNSLDASSITAGTITADRLVIGGIDSSRLALGAVGQIVRDYQEGSSPIITDVSQYLSATIGAVSYARAGVLVNISVEVRNDSAYFGVNRTGGVIDFPGSDASYSVVYVEIRKNGSRISPPSIATSLSIISGQTIINYTVADPSPGKAAATYTLHMNKFVSAGNTTTMYSGTMTVTELRR